MKLSTKGRYGLRAMVDLALNSNGEHVALNSIAERQNISVNYLEQVFSILKKAGIVKSVKGSQGGYILTDIPVNLKVGRILRVLEGELSVVEIQEDNAAAPGSIQHCININVWGKMNECLNQVVDSLTLDDLVNDYRKMSNSDSVMYYI